MRSLSIVIPAFNEAATIEETVHQALAVGAHVVSSLEVAVCDDASTDNTAGRLRALSATDPRIRAFHRRRNRGIEASIRALYATARGEHCFLISADGQWPMAALVDMAAVLDREGADLVVGVRRSKSEVYTPYRRALSASYEWLVRALGSPAGDPGSIKLGLTAVLRTPVAARGVFAEGERLIRAGRNGYRVAECQVPFAPRRAGRATGARPRVVAAAVADVLRVVASLAVGWPAPSAPIVDADDPHDLTRGLVTP